MQVAGVLLQGVASAPVVAETLLLIHADGPHNGTTFIDSSPYNRTIGREFGSATNGVTSTTQFKFGGSSAYLNNGPRLTVADTPDMELGNSDFCMEFWVYIPLAPTGLQYLVAKWGAGNAYQIHFGNGGNNKIYADFPPTNVASTSDLPIAQWVHIAVTRAGNTARLFINGVLEDTEVMSAAVADSTAPLRIGGFSSYPMKGYIDEFRIRKGEPVYTTNFTPPSVPWTF